MMTLKFTPFVDYNWMLKLLDTRLNKPSNQNSVSVVKPTNNETLFYDSENYCNKQTNFHCLPAFIESFSFK